MPLTLDKIEIDEHSLLLVRELTDSGAYHRRVLTPDMTLADSEHQELKDIVEAEWTDEVKSAWATYKAEKESKSP